MTLRQAGVAAFAAAPGQLHISDAAKVASPHQVIQRRAKDDWQGLLGFLRGIHKRWTITFDENDPEARFPLINGQEIASAAQQDKRDTGRKTRAVFQMKDRFRSNAARRPAERAGSA